MSTVKAFTIAQLQALQNGLRADFASVLEANTNIKNKSAELSTPAYIQKFTPQALAQMRREQTERFQRPLLDIVRSLPQRRQTIENQQNYWESDFYRDALLYAPPPEIKIDGILPSERNAQILAKSSADFQHALLENTGRLWLTKELELMDPDSFVETIEEATEQGQAAVIYLASLVADHRP